MLNTAHWATWGPDNLDERLAAIDEIVELADRVGEGWLASEAVGWSFYHWLEAGDVGAAARALTNHRERTATLRQPFITWRSLTHRVVFDLFQGRLAEADAGIQEAVRIGERSQNRSTFVVYGAQTALLRAAQGRVGDTREIAEMAKGIAEQYPHAPSHRCAVASLYAFLGDTGEARRQLDRLALTDVSSLPRDPYWLGAVTSLCETAWLLRDEALARLLYDAVLPFTGRCAVMPFMLASGSTARSAALVAATLGRQEEAERLFHEAIAANESMGARPWLAYARQELAEMLLERGRPGDMAEARELLHGTLEAAETLGFTTERARALLDHGGPAASRVARPPARTLMGSDLAARPREGTDPQNGLFLQEGDYWRIEFSGRSIAMKGGKGLVYLKRLLAEPEREIHALDLAADIAEPGANGETGVHAGQAPEGLSIGRLGDAGDTLDSRARDSYRERIEDLKGELSEAESFGDRERARCKRTEIETLATELGRAYGLGGRARREADVAERARKAVTSRIRDTITRIGKENPELARHLENTIRTGILCSYRPGMPLRWRTET